MEWIIQTDANWVGLVARVILGLVIFPHGAQKLLGWFGGYGYSGTMGYFTQSLGIPYAFGLLAAGFISLLGVSLSRHAGIARTAEDPAMIATRWF